MRRRSAGGKFMAFKTQPHLHIYFNMLFSKMAAALVRRHRLLLLLVGCGVAVYLMSTYYVVPRLTVTSRKSKLSDGSGTRELPPRTLWKRRRPSCSPKTNIFFLKTHKCASSTVQNILLRFGTKRGLTFVLPTLGNYLGNQVPFNRLMARNAPWHSIGYNIFCHHTVFDEKEVAAVLPNDTVYVGILRHPVDLFESLYSYARLDLHYKQSIEKFALSRNASQLTFEDRAEGYLGVNQMLYDFGVRPANFSNYPMVRKALKDIQRGFSLIMIAEHFDESLVLLRELLCWSVDDVVYFRHNARKAEKKRKLADNVRNRLQHLNAADMLLYRHFVELFWKKVHHFGFQRMRQEVAALRNRIREFEEFCISAMNTSFSKSSNGSHGIFSAFSDIVEDIHVNNNNNITCRHLAKSEMAFTRQLKMLQIMRAWKKFNDQEGVVSPGGPVNIFNRAGNLSGHTTELASWLHSVSKDVGFSPVQYQFIRGG